MFKKLRIALLLYVLGIVALTSWSTKARNTEWIEPLWVIVYPINGEGNEASERYVETLAEENFQPIESMMAEQAKRYGVGLNKPVEVKLAPPLSSQPPAPPQSGNPLAIAYWSLKLRWWASRNDTFDGPKDIRVYVLYYDPNERTSVAHSLGLQKGFLGVVHAFGDRQYDGRNNIVIAHEMLHTLGASDKYDAHTNQAVFPDGFADPERVPRYPQQRAEIMAGRIPTSASESKMPKRLSGTLIGSRTATEIGWTSSR